MVHLSPSVSFFSEAPSWRLCLGEQTGANCLGGRGGLTFKSPAARKYEVPSRLPLLDFAIPQTYAGLLKLTNKPDETEELFFWLIPTESPKANKDIALWTNGGPGCSSLLGAFQENGPVMWDEGRTKAIKNPYSWSQAASILYLEHPTNVGFSSGKAVINNEDQVAEYIFKFLNNFLNIFPEFKGGNFYLTGESYAGMYLSYTAKLIYARQKELALQLKGVLFIDPVLAPSVYQEDMPVYPFVKQHANVFKFNATFMAQLEKLHHDCGYANFMTKMANNLPTNFDVYNILHTTAGPDPLFSSSSKPTYLDNPEVRKALNVPGKAPWTRCSDSPTIFPQGDSSLPPSVKVLPSIIGKGKTIIAHGDLDARLFVEGMKLGIQSMTWQDKQGFQEPINKKFLVDGKLNGLFQTERNLTFVQVSAAGHMIPHDQPQAGLAIFKFLIGASDSLGTA
ncbi:hypothetical protein VP01_1235g3 [Puccinia sorghi]|uniref:Carboxypeptidase n=1 Tax=Puccinia sorghi TaxID=27349 RepID=A0A0L6VPP5_9BASI|nr:hypothetical protein VP01_1235g3 [Puccinia sorghi]